MGSTSPIQISQVIAADIEIPVDLPHGVPFGSVSISGIPRLLFSGQKYNIIFENDCGSMSDSNNLDLNFLNETFARPIGKEEILFQLSGRPDVLKHLRAEVRKCKTGDYDALKGSIFDLDLNIDPMGRFSPCGLGYFGYSNGLDHNP